jgi:hypothetical protein
MSRTTKAQTLTQKRNPNKKPLYKSAVPQREAGLPGQSDPRNPILKTHFKKFF